jgi:tetratricopeptide (TPR) repeat protein
LLQVRGEDPVPPSRLQSRTPRDLETICLKCLAKAPGQRYGDAAALAEDLRRFQAGEAILARPVGWVQHLVKWVKRKPTTAALWGVLLAVALFGAGFGLWLVLARAEAAREVDGKLGQAVLLCDEEKWGAARVMAEQAEALLARGGGSAERRRRVRELLADLEMVERLEEVRLRQAERNEGHSDFRGGDADYAAAFREYGLDVEALTPAEAAARIRERPIQNKLAAALDHWAFFRREHGDAAAWQRLVEIAQLADPDPRRNRLRDAVRDQDVKGLKALAAESDVADLPAPTVLLLGDALAKVGARPEAEQVLRQAQRQYPGDFWINHTLAYYLLDVRSRQVDDEIRFYTAALALRPHSAAVHVNLGDALSRKGRADAAIAEFREALRLDKNLPEAHNNLGLALMEKGQVDAAMTEYREALRLKPHSPKAHNNLGALLCNYKRDYDGAIKEFREAIGLKQDYPEAHHNLGIALGKTGQVDAAIAEYREAIRHEKDYPQAHNYLGALLCDHKSDYDGAVKEFQEAIRLKPDYVQAHYNLGVALRQKGQVDAAIAAYKEAIRLRPDYADAHVGLGIAFQTKGNADEGIAAYKEAIRFGKGNPQAHTNLGALLCDYKKDYDGAIKEFREAIRLQKNYPDAHRNLGIALEGKGQLDEAIAAYRDAIRVRKDFHEAHNNLGTLLCDYKGDYDGAIAAFTEAIRINKRQAVYHFNLGRALQKKGLVDQAIAAYREALRLNKDYADAKQWLRRYERLFELDDKLTAILKGEARPANAAERIEFAQACTLKGLHRASARLYGEAFTERPELAADLKAAHRDDAACAAALAGCGRGEDAAQVDATERARWRQQALEWLRADLTLWAKLLDSDTPQARAGVQQRLRHWQRDPDLAGLRDPAALAELPEAEREGWRQLWADVGALLKRASPE